MIIGDDSIGAKVIGCSIAVHRELGPGLLESIYEEALSIELGRSGIPFVRQMELPVIYKDVQLSGAFRVDLLVDNTVVVELKCVDRILPVHEAQVLSYLRLGGWRIGLLINFKSAVLKNGIRRVLL
ncbi:MAG TPA: GxxExxY protein [Spirochaetales bacterium]|nr:GxxExxY protein [Spirochaetales bacterium]HPG86757.1 GxxExxY protein [Spirochaetales bacterium]HPM72483.1 GxxExxY protein [Spirochaetales bacterium]